MSIIILGIDPGFANVGISAVEFAKNSKKLLETKVITTEKSKKKKNLREQEDDLRRLSEIERVFVEFIDRWKPHLVSAEHMPQVRSQTVVRKIAMVFGAMHAIAHTRGLPILTYQPAELKVKMTGDKKASKEEMIAAVAKILGDDEEWLEHNADAAAATMCAEDDPLFAVLMSNDSRKTVQ